MTTISRFATSLLLISALSSAVHAQLYETLPSEEQLNRYGLTMAWWGQAIIDPRRDRIQFITADEQNVYVQASSGIVTTFGGETGRRLWSTLLGLPDQVGYPATSHDEQLLISIGMQLYSLDKMTGELLWNFRAPDHPSASPQVDEDRIYIGTVDGSVYTYNLGVINDLYQERLLPKWVARARLWRFQTPGEIISPPVPVGETLVFGSEKGIVYGVAATNKKLKFQFESDGAIRTPLGHSGENVYIGDENSRTYCINHESGRIRWVFSSGAQLTQEPLAIGKQVFVIPRREGLFALTETSGREMWRQPRVTEFLAASGTRIYASDLSGNLVILNRKDGRIIGILPFRHFPIHVQNDRTDRIYLANQGGTVIALRERDSEYPMFHLHPERRPILPEFAPDAPEEKEEKEEEKQAE